MGPGLVVAATGVGAADLVATLVAGAKFGYTLLWVVGARRGRSRWSLVEGAGPLLARDRPDDLRGLAQPRSLDGGYFAPYIVVWGLVYGATAMSSSALPIVALFPDLSLRWTGVRWRLSGSCCSCGSAPTPLFEKVMAALVGVMFVRGRRCGRRDHAQPRRGRCSGCGPIIPDDSLFNILGIAGGVGGTITLAAYGYWLREKGWSTPRIHAGDAARQRGRVPRDRHLRGGDAGRWVRSCSTPPTSPLRER